MTGWYHSSSTVIVNHNDSAKILPSCHYLLGHCEMWHTLTINIHTVTSIVTILDTKVADAKGSLNLYTPQLKGGRKQSDMITAHETTNLVMA